MVAKSRIFGRDVERETVGDFVAASQQGPGVLAITGPAGIGKTVLLQEAIAEGRARSYAILSCWPTETEARLAYAALGDLLEGITRDLMQSLPGPQRRALEAALLLNDARGVPEEPRAVGLGLLSLLRSMSEAAPVLVAVDGVGWLDGPSGRALEFAFRRLESEPISLVLSASGDSLVPLLTTASDDRTVRLELMPLAQVATERILAEQFHGSISRQTASQIHRISGGNPLFGLQIARAVVSAGARLKPGELPRLPRTLHQMVKEQLRSLDPDALAVLQVISALSHPTTSRVEEVLPVAVREADGLGKALAADVVEITGDRIQPKTVMLCSVAYQDMSPVERRALHQRVAAVVQDAEERAWHLALAVVGTDEEVARALDEGARIAADRGAPDAAADLLERAAGLTPKDRKQDRRRRRLEAAEASFRAGDPARARVLLEAVLEKSVSGQPRADVLRRLGWIRYHEGGYREARELFDQALVAVGDDTSLRAMIERDLAWAALKFGDSADAASHASRALELAERVGEPAGLAEALTAMGLADAVLGKGLRPDVMRRVIELEQKLEDERITHRPSRSVGVLLKWTLELPVAISKFESLYCRAVERGDESSQPSLLFHLSELEISAGMWEQAEEHVRQGIEIAVRTQQDATRADLLATRGLVEALRGAVDAARSSTIEALALAQRTESAAAHARATAAAGFLELSLGNPAEAHRHLGPLAETVPVMNLADPGIVRFLADELEALVALGELDQAERLARSMELLAKSSGALLPAVAARCRGLLAAARGEVEGAALILDLAVQRQERLGHPFELARTLLIAGSVQRRLKHKALARTHMERALHLFQELGAALWSERATMELARTGRRTSSPLELSESEKRVAELAAAGKTNREIADAIFVSVRTVENQLSSVFRKLGLRSRTELASHLASREL